MAEPVYRVEIAFTTDLTGYLRFGVGRIGVDRLSGQFSGTAFTDLSSRLLAFRVSRGREDELSGVTAGHTSALLRDDDGALDPENGSSAYAPNVKLGRQIRITATHLGITYGLGYGFIDAYDPAPTAVGANMGISATDLFKRLEQRKVYSGFPSQFVGERIAEVVALLEWPSEGTSLEQGQLTVPAVGNLEGVTALSHIDVLIRAERGTFFIAGDGKATYQDRHHRLKETSRGTFGAGGLKVRRVITAYNDAGIYNEVRITRSGGVEQVASDADSAGVYGWRNYNLATDAADLLPSDASALGLATWLVTERKDPMARVRAIELDPADDDTLWGHVLGAEIGDRITLTHDVPGSKGVVAQDFIIERIDHEWTPTGDPPHLCTWGLSRAPTTNYLRLGTGQIGVAQMAY